MGENPTEDEVLIIVNISPILLVMATEVLTMMLEADLDSSGTIEFSEFLQLMKTKYSSDDMQSDLKAAFKIFDRDRDGFICIEEFKRVSTLLGANLRCEEIEELMDQADLDGNGLL